MLVIGHRGAGGEAHENSIAALHTAIDAGADMVEFDVRLTRDDKLVLSHDFHLYRSHKQLDIVRRLTLAELKKRTAGSEQPIVTLDQALKVCAGKIFVMIELKDKGSGLATLELITRKYKDIFDSVMLSSFSTRELSRVRSLNKKVKLAMLMRLNPFAFLAWERKLHLSAVGLHRLHVNKLAIQAAHQLDMLVYVYTVNRTAALSHLAAQDIDAVVTDFPSRFVERLS